MMGITRKAALACILKKMKDIYPQDFNFFPKSWSVPSQLVRLKTEMHENKRLCVGKGGAAPVYIVKPSDMA
jgi:hypothetical protein